MYGIYRILSLSHICNSATSHPIIISFATWKKRSVLCSIFFLSSWHYDPHYYYYYYYSMNAIVFFSTAILLYFFKLSSITIILHCIACCITICIYYYQISTYYLFWVSQKNEMTKKEIHLMLYTKSLQDISHHS